MALTAQEKNDIRGGIPSPLAAASVIAALDAIDGQTPGTGLASHALVLDASGQIDTFITTGNPTTTAGVGAKAGATVTAVEQGSGVIHRTILTCVATPITMADEAGVVQHGGVKLYDFPEGLILSLGALINGDVTTPVHDHASGGTIATWDGDIGLGTVTASNNATLAATEQNILQSTAATQATGQVGNVDAVSAATLLTESAASWLDGTGGALDLYLNLLIDDSANNDAHTALFTGVVTFTWMNLGDIT